jgi:hypothetical protein
MGHNILKEATDKLQDNWKQLSKADIARAGDVDQLIKMIIEKTGETRESVSERVYSIIDEVRTDRPRKTMVGRLRGFIGGVLKFSAAMAAVAIAVAAGLAFWRKRTARTSEATPLPEPSASHPSHPR